MGVRARYGWRSWVFSGAAKLAVGAMNHSVGTVFFGYTFIYTNNVARPGNPIDRSINPTQSPFF